MKRPLLVSAALAALVVIAVGAYLTQRAPTAGKPDAASGLPPGAPPSAATPLASPAPAMTPTPGSTPQAGSPQQAANPAVTAAPAVQSSPSPVPVTREEFQAFARKTLDSLPKIADLKKLKEDEVAHGTPALLVDAGRKLGQVARMLHDNAELKDAGVAFYSECSTGAELPTPVRALCYSHLEGKDQQAVDAKVPPAVKTLSAKVPSTTPTN